MKRKQEIVFFKSPKNGKNFEIDDLCIIAKDFAGDIVINGKICGEGDITTKGNLIVLGQIYIEGDINVNKLYSKGIICYNLNAKNVVNYGKDIECNNITVEQDLLCFSKNSKDTWPLGGSIYCTKNIIVNGKLFCKEIGCKSVKVDGNLYVHEKLMSESLKVNKCLYYKGIIISKHIDVLKKEDKSKKGIINFNHLKVQSIM